MKYALVKISIVALFVGLAVRQIRTMEEVRPHHEIELEEPGEVLVPSLQQLALQPAIDAIYGSVLTMNDLYAVFAKLPPNVQLALALGTIKDARFPGTVLDKLQFAYKAASEGTQEVLDPLFAEAVQQIDLCLFVHHDIGALLPDYQKGSFTNRDQSLIHVLLAKHAVHLPEKRLTEPVMTIKFNAEAAVDALISPDGTKLAWGTADRTLCVWDLQRNKPLALFRLPESIVDDPPLAWSPDSNTLAIGAQDGSIHFWNIEAQEPPVVRLKISGISDSSNDEMEARNIERLAQLSEENLLFFNSLAHTFIENLQQHNILSIHVQTITDKAGTLWFVKRRTDIPPRKQFKADDHSIYSLSFSPDGNFLTTLSDERRVRVWSLDQVFNNVVPLRILPLFDYTFAEHTSPVAVALSEYGKRLAIAPIGTEVVVFDVTTQQPLVELDTDDFDAGYIGLGANAIALSSNGRYLSYTFAGRYYLYDIDQKKQVLEFNRGHVNPTQVFTPSQSFAGYGGFVSCMADEHPLVVYGIRSRGRMSVKFPRSHELDEPLSFSGDGSYFVTRGRDLYTVWQLPTDYLRGTLTWLQLQDELKARCLQIVPVKNARSETFE